MKPALAWICAAMVAGLLAGCQSADIVQVSPDTFRLTAETSRRSVRELRKLRADVVREANEFAETQGKVAVGVTAEVGLGPAKRASYEYVFRVLERDAPEIGDIHLETRVVNYNGTTLTMEEEPLRRDEEEAREAMNPTPRPIPNP